MPELSINTTNSHDVILDIIYRVKIRDVMSKNPHISAPDDSVMKAKKALKEFGISGMPVAKDRQLVGIISTHDIFECYERGSMDDPVRKFMSRNITVLEEDMPISFALTYFDKYKYRRFPVLNKNKEISGIITSRDINVFLLNEINSELQKMDSKKQKESEQISKGRFFKQFNIRKFDFENAGKVSFSIKKTLKEKNIPQQVIRRVSIAVYELEINQVVHSNGGYIIFIIDENEIIIKAIDNGPGIDNLDQALEEGYSTASEWIRSQGFGAGMGLPNVKRVSDNFQITSTPENGTEVIINIKTGNQDESK